MKISLLLSLSVATILTTLSGATLNAQEVDEYQVKAAFLYNFAKFVEWPAEASGDAHQVLTICVLGRDPFGQALDDVIAGKVIAGRPLALRRITDARHTGGCRMLFISSSENSRSLSLLNSDEKRGVLTVGEAGNATAECVAIKFTLEGGKIRFEINLAEVQEEKLRLSSKLLSLATVVRRTPASRQ
jgi:hypothetical protein